LNTQSRIDKVFKFYVVYWKALFSSSLHPEQYSYSQLTVVWISYG